MQVITGLAVLAVLLALAYFLYVRAHSNAQKTG